MNNQPYYSSGMNPMEQQNSGKGFCIAALILGIGGIVGILVVPFLSFVASLLAVIFGAKGRKKTAAALGKANGMGTAGLVLGIVGMVLDVLLVIFAIIGLILLASIVNSFDFSWIELLKKVSDMGVNELTEYLNEIISSSGIG